MTKERARNFVEVALGLNEREDVFSMTLPSSDDLTLVSECFRELGCYVFVNEQRNLLRVDCRTRTAPIPTEEAVSLN
jgi:hypothetical protein